MLTGFDHLTFQILYAFRTRHSDGFFRVPARAYAALSFRLSGTGRFWADGRELTVQCGDILYIPANMPYEVEYSSTEMIVVHLTDCNYPHAEVITPRSPLVLQAAFEELLSKWDERHAPFLAKSQIYALLDLLATEQRLAPDQTEQALLSRCIDYMKEHFSNASINVANVCNATYVCRSTLQRAFHKHLGTSPGQYLSNLRLNHAMHLLGQGSNVKEAALASGFADEKYFSRVFKTTYGFPPSQIRKESL